jgi:ATP-dependent DNA helicase RecQ
MEEIYGHLNQYFGIAFGETPDSTFDFIIAKFIDTYSLPYLKTYNAIKILDREGILHFDEHYTHKSTFKMLIDHNQLYRYMDTHSSSEKLLQLLMRTYSGIFDQVVTINEFGLAGKLGILNKKVVDLLKQLDHDGIISYNEGNGTSQISFNVPREDKRTINNIAHHIKNQEEHKLEKLLAVKNYVKQNDICRNILIRNYFGESVPEECGHCDYCLSKNKEKVDYTVITKQILNQLKEGSKSSTELLSSLSVNEEDLFISLKILLEKNKLTITSHHQYKMLNDE